MRRPPQLGTSGVVFDRNGNSGFPFQEWKRGSRLSGTGLCTAIMSQGSRRARPCHSNCERYWPHLTHYLARETVMMTSTAINLRVLSAAAMALFFAEGSSWAQNTPAPAPGPAAQAAQQPLSGSGRFLAIDPFAGFVGHGTASATSGDEQAEESGIGFRGWEAGATVRVARWFGITGSYARTSGNGFRLHHYFGGPQFSTAYAGQGVRGFAHVLLGAVVASSPTAPSETAPELVIGGGFDAFGFLRLQLDYLRSNVHLSTSQGLAPRNQIRMFLGAVVPLCLRSCRPDGWDGIDISRQPRKD